MALRAWAFLAGVWWLHGLGHLPSPAWGVLWLPLVLLFYRGPLPLRLLVWGLSGFFWALIHTHWMVGPPLPAELAGSDRRVTGIIHGLPESQGRVTRFTLKATSVQGTDWRGRVRVGWYGDAPNLAPGERWRMTLRLRPPGGLRNPGGFDYEGWLFRKGDRATAYVRDADSAHRIGYSGAPVHGVNRLRGALAAGIDKALDPQAPFAGILQALAVGERSGIGPEQWDLLIATGTNHLMAISGLHVGLTAALGYALVLALWRRLPPLALRLPAQRAAVPAALACALAYAALAGFSVPTQRALVMLLVALGALWWQRTQRPLQTLSLALLAVLLLDPRSLLAPGFWLSFAAVGVILYVLAGRTGPAGGGRAWWRVQWAAGLGLLPLTLVLFQQGSLISPLANLVAVPWMSFVVVPLALAGAALSAVSMPLAAWAWNLAHDAVALLWPLLEFLVALPGAHWRHAAPAWTLVPALLGMFWFLGPRGLPARWLGLLLILPLLWPPRAEIPEGGFRLTLLDVGQGLAAVVRTREHTLVYDTGPRFGPRFDAGEAAVVPYLYQVGRPRVDRLVISHGDLDHAGGAASLRALLPVTEILSRDVSRFPGRACRAGERWSWDGVAFTVLHPPPDWGDDNVSSCVLRVHGPGGSVLLPGDVEGLGQAVLLRRAGEALKADVLVLPHHGAGGALPAAFLDAVSPRLALVSRGFGNRAGHPHPAVRARLRDRGIPLLDTARSGALRVDVSPRGIRVAPGYRHAARRHWHR
ncbi:DNA internalization-related competence protein ComEC/Rec2 [Ectothiorhodospira mobilis]|uniref:DNA internalization-related competence protein ComEC/Rec2 n=1 Tax=Ectothiorhodospira mobilis TaxID=195064 RepID=UPI0019053BF2|nr:DNA internalization-related competence protein ComEC/Rec2 [Ectothiorhodospira mobilis]MBK1691424.1 DNA internalization-related competence protein ComEC/Rec2 [Ectothiorhodospira mobilis]